MDYLEVKNQYQRLERKLDLIFTFNRMTKLPRVLLVNILRYLANDAKLFRCENIISKCYEQNMELGRRIVILNGEASDLDERFMRAVRQNRHLSNHILTLRHQLEEHDQAIVNLQAERRRLMKLIMEYVPSEKFEEAFGMSPDSDDTNTDSQSSEVATYNQITIQDETRLDV